MFKSSQNTDKFSIGLCLDNRHLQVVILKKCDEKIQLVDAIRNDLASSMDYAKAEPLHQTADALFPGSAPDFQKHESKTKAHEPDFIDNAPLATGILDITPQLEGQEIEIEEASTPSHDTSVLSDILRSYQDTTFTLAISLIEPQTYYSHLDTDWDLRGKKLKKRIIRELSTDRTGGTLQPDMFQVLKLANNSQLVVVRDSDGGVIRLLESIQPALFKRLPSISFVESAEISIVNLVIANYQFGENEITVIIHVGHEISRLIFLKGMQLLHISQMIGEGSDSFYEFGSSPAKLASTICSRLLLEQDNLNLEKIDHIILTGSACQAEFEKPLHEWFGKLVAIERVQLPQLSVGSMDSDIIESLPQLVVPLGAAWRSLDVDNVKSYAVDLTPNKIREKQKVFKLGIPGWIIFSLIPILTFLFTFKIINMREQVRNLRTQYQKKQQELVALKEIDARISVERNKLIFYQSTYGVLDSLVAGTYTWSDFLLQIALQSEAIGDIWITNISRIGQNLAYVKGYSKDSEKIPLYANAFNNSILRKVIIQEIKNRKVYGFEIEIEITDKQPTPAKEADRGY